MITFPDLTANQFWYRASFITISISVIFHNYDHATFCAFQSFMRVCVVQDCELNLSLDQNVTSLIPHSNWAEPTIYHFLSCRKSIQSHSFAQWHQVASAECHIWGCLWKWTWTPPLLASSQSGPALPKALTWQTWMRLTPPLWDTLEIGTTSPCIWNHKQEFHHQK